jgi:hypothetical protein
MHGVNESVRVEKHESTGGVEIVRVHRGKKYRVIIPPEEVSEVAESMLDISQQGHIIGWKYSNGKLIRLLKEFADKVGRSPTKRMVRDSDEMPHHETYIDRFGSWNDALDEAGLEPNQQYGSAQLYSESELIDSLKELNEEVEGAPTTEDCQKFDITPSPQTYQRRFGGWESALAEADIELERRYHETQARMKKYAEVRKYIQNNPNATRQEVADETGYDKKIVTDIMIAENATEE